MTDSLQADGHGARSWLGGHSHGDRGMPADAFQQRGRLAERVEDKPPAIPKGFLENSEDELLRELRDAARILRYSARNVDQYQVGALYGATESETFIELFSDFSVIGEIIEAILVTGPVNTPFNLELGKHTFPGLITNAQGFLLLAPIRMKLDPQDKRTLTGIGAPAPIPTQPAVPATGVAQQNLNAYPVQVVISPNGATITNVSVNGVTVGTAAGTYVVPAFGAISIAYSVATPTWVWTDAIASLPAAGNWGFALMGRPDDPGRRY